MPQVVNRELRANAVDVSARHLPRAADHKPGSRPGCFSLHTLPRTVKLYKLASSLLVSGAILLGTGVNFGLADDECGEGEGSGTVTEITCDTSIYDPSVGGNIIIRRR